MNTSIISLQGELSEAFKGAQWDIEVDNPGDDGHYCIFVFRRLLRPVVDYTVVIVADADRVASRQATRVDARLILSDIFHTEEPEETTKWVKSADDLRTFCDEFYACAEQWYGESTTA